MKSLLTVLLFIFEISKTKRLDGVSLFELGSKINKTITKLSGTPLQLIKDVWAYYEELEGVRQDMELEKAYTFRLLFVLQDTGGPPHIRYSINTTALAIHYCWLPGDEKEFNGVIKDTRNEWMTILKINEEKKTKYAKEKV